MALHLRALVFSLVAMAALAGCGSSETAADAAGLIAFNDYESVVGWQADPNAVTRDHAHSGRYAVMVAPGKEYGLGYGMPLGKVTGRRLHRFRVSAWGYMTDANATARLGVQVVNPATNTELMGDGIDFGPAVKEPRKWVKISKEITLPDTFGNTQELRVFLWRASAETPAYLDDLRISLLE